MGGVGKRALSLFANFFEDKKLSDDSYFFLITPAGVTRHLFSVSSHPCEKIFFADTR